MPVTSITAFHNLGAGSYSVSFSEAVTILTGFSTETSILTYSPSSNVWSQSVIFESPTTAITITIRNGNLDTDCTLIAILQTPLHLTAADPIQVASPVVPVT